MKTLNISLLVFVSLLMVTASSSVRENMAYAGRSKKKVSRTKDYLSKGVVLAAFSMEDGGFSETGFYPSKIITPAGKETKNQYEVESLIGTSDVAMGDKKWTGNVIVNSRPAGKKGLGKGDVVLFVTDSNPRNADDLKKSVWHRGVVQSVDELYKKRVKIMYLWYLDRKDESDRVKDIPLENIRIIKNPAIPAIKRFQ